MVVIVSYSISKFKKLVIFWVADAFWCILIDDDLLFSHYCCLEFFKNYPLALGMDGRLD